MDHHVHQQYRIMKHLSMTKRDLWCGGVGIPLALLLAGWAGHRPAPEFGEEDDEPSKLTVVICCGTQGIVDQDHEVSLTVKDEDDQELTVTLPVPEYTETEAIAGGLALALREAGVSGAESSETTNPRFRSSKHTAEDLNLPPGWDIEDVTVRKKGSSGFDEDDGHLKAFIGKKKISNPSGAPGGSGLLAGHSPVVLNGFDVLRFDLIDFTGDPLRTEIDIWGLKPDGVSRFNYSSHVTVSPSTVHPLKDLGDFLDRVGMLVVYTGLTSLEAHVGPSGHTVVEVFFSAHEDTGDSSPSSHLVRFSFSAE